jgi:hypothetical protein
MMYHYTCPVPFCGLGASDEIEAEVLKFVVDHHQYHLTYDFPDPTPQDTEADIELRTIISDIELNLESILNWQNERGSA